MTQHNGICIYYPNGQKNEKRISYQNEISKLLIKQVEDRGFQYYQQNYAPEFENWLSLYWNGYSQQTRYSYVIPSDELDYEEVTKGYSKVIRYDVKKARESLTIEESDDLECFHKLHTSTFSRQGKRAGCSLSLLRKIDEECRKHDARRLLIAKDEAGRAYSGAYFVMDNRCVYYILSGTDTETRNTNSLSMLIDEGIRFASETGRKFDFEGSMIENINDYFRKFGGKLAPYYNVSKLYSTNPFLRYAVKRRIRQ